MKSHFHNPIDIDADDNMGNQSGNVMSQAEIGRRPTDAEMMVLLQLQRKLFTRLVLSPEHLGLLERYWSSHFVNKTKSPAFERISVFWRTEGGCTSENPADDLRSMGELGLQCLVFFAESYPGESRMMKRAKGGYPFVKAAMAVARTLSEAMHLVDEEGQPGKFPVMETLYWQLLESEQSFYRLFSLSFLLFEELYCEELARDRTLPVTQHISTAVITQLVDATKDKLLERLRQAPLQIQDLRSICSNAGRILDGEDGVLSASRGRERSASAPVARDDRLARWKQHQSGRKSMRDAVKGWGVNPETAQSEKDRNRMSEDNAGVVPRLVPRAPEISMNLDTHHALDIFEGLVTKNTESPGLDSPSAVARAS